MAHEVGRSDQTRLALCQMQSLGHGRQDRRIDEPPDADGSGHNEVSTLANSHGRGSFGFWIMPYVVFILNFSSSPAFGHIDETANPSHSRPPDRPTSALWSRAKIVASSSGTNMIDAVVRGQMPPPLRKITPNSRRTFSLDASGVQRTGTAMAEAFFYVCFAAAILVCVMIIANAFD